MSNVLSDDKRQQIIALGQLGWSLRRIEQATGVRRETASAYLKAAGISVRQQRPRSSGHWEFLTTATRGIAQWSDKRPQKTVNKRGTPVAHSGVMWLYHRTVMRKKFAKFMGTSKDAGQAAGKVRLPIWVRVTSLTLTLALSATVALGVPLHTSERGCNLPMEMAGCEHMVPSAPGVAEIQLCCLLDCQEPGSTGSVSIQVPSLNLAPVHQVAPRAAFVLAKPTTQQSWRQSSSFKPPDTYLKNLALLI